MEHSVITQYRGYILSVRAIPLRALEKPGSLPAGFISLVQVVRCTDILVDWCMPCPHTPWETPAEALREGTHYLQRLINTGAVGLETSLLQ
ncbi:hypothetical protein D3C85_1027260 [compost metagenome]|jgi:hypothetical protein|uniref:hypothetical protein n=1 Tax=Achromobacter sp. TaxID=134375 RepID=UPI000FBE4D60